MATVTRERPLYNLLDGAAGGFLGGLVMALLSMLVFPLLSLGSVWQPFYLIAAVIDQRWAGLSGFVWPAFISGLLLHLLMSVVVGLVTTWLASITPGDAIAVKVLALAVIVWLVAQFIVLPDASPATAARFPAWLFFAVHLAYGAVLGGYLAWRGPVVEATEQHEGAVHTMDADWRS